VAYLVHSPQERAEMLAEAGVDDFEQLLRDVPVSLRTDGLDLPPGLSELETVERMRGLAAQNQVYPARLTFRGGGVYRRFVPAVVDAVISKPAFYTAYTPYQPEASQGWLQAIFEYQTMIAELTGLAVSNASLYDGATAVAEAAMMASVHTGRHEVLVAGHLHPEYLDVLRCYADGRGFTVREVPAPDGVSAGGEVELAVGSETAAVVFQQPNFLGLLEPVRALTDAAHGAGALAIACVDPISLALLAPPGQYGADIAVGEGQQLGLPLSFGGPHLGFIACRRELVRRLPGRLVGQAHDAAGRRGFVLTLTAREQHIRREKATSNICTNHALCALAATAYLAYLGPDGLRQVAEAGLHRAHDLAARLEALPGVSRAFPAAAFLNEFPVRVADAEALDERLRERGILGGLPVERWYPDLEGVMTFACTEVNDSSALAELVEAMR
jgi:glycine dehydrogenase subunit 1